MSHYATGIVAKLITPEDLLDEDDSKFEIAERTPGAFYYCRSRDDDEGGIIHSCPCGCGVLGFLRLTAPGTPRWTNSGTREQPTLLPSVGIRPLPGQTAGSDGFHWHGWLREGVWVSV